MFPREYCLEQDLVQERAIRPELEHDLEVLRLSQAQLAGLVSIADDAIISLDAEQRTTLYNQGAERIFGYTSEEVLGQPLDVLLPPRVVAAHRDHIAAFAQSPEKARRMGERREIFGRRKDGSEFPAEASISKLELNGERIFTVILRDITERKQAEAQHQQFLAREQRTRAEAEAAQRSLAFLAEASRVLTNSLDFETTLASLAALIVPTLADLCIVDVVDEAGSIRRVGIAYADPAREAVVRDHLRRDPPDPAGPHPVAEVLRTGQPGVWSQTPESLLAAIAHDDEHLERLRQLRSSSSMIVPLVAREQTLGTVAFVTTESGRHYGPPDLALAEELARRAALAVDNARLYREAQEAIREREIFLSIASHELKAPLAVLDGYVQLLLRRMESQGLTAERSQRALRTVHEQAVRLHQLLDQLLDISRLQGGQVPLERQPVDLCALARRLIRAIRPTLEQHRLELLCPDEPVVVAGEELRLEEVLQNLLQNAIKYSPKGGPITVRIQREGQQAIVAVSDQGLGISAEVLPRLFQRFYRATTEGTGKIPGMGLGLYVVREVVALHGGTVTVESKEGEGSTFIARLPFHGAP